MSGITTPYAGYETRYPKLLELSNKQFEENMWFASEIRVVEEDRLEMLYQLTDTQQRIIKAIMPMFRHYEDNVAEFWTEVYMKYFLAPECKEGAVVIAAIERAVHERFYDKINIVYGTDKDEHYLSYLQDPVFKKRARWLGETLRGEDKHEVCLVYGLVEGVSIFSLFALIRSFQANGYNKIATTVKGTKQSAIDELLHSEYLATSFNYYYAEKGISLEHDDAYYFDKLTEQAHNVVENEKFILTSLLQGDDTFNGVNVSEYFKLFEFLANLYFKRLNCTKVPFPETTESELYEWFVSTSVGYSDQDFFSKGIGKEYETAWDKTSFGKVWSVQ